MSTYKDELEFVTKASDDLFPEFLFTTLKNDFEDGYYERSIVSDKLSASIRGLRRRYSNFFEYAEAITIYNEYIDNLIEKYGSLSIIKNALKAGLMEDPVPAKPKLKNNRQNREFMRAGITPSQKIEKENISDDEMVKLVRNTIPGKMGEDIDESHRFDKLSKSTKKMFRRQSSTMAGAMRRENLYRSNTSNHGADFIIEYLNERTKGEHYDSKGKITDMSILDIIKEDEKYASMPPELVEDEFKLHTPTYQNGRLVNYRESQKIEILKELYGLGIDVIGSFGKAMDKKEVKMVRSSIGDYEPMTKKELKKVKKKQKHERELIQRRSDGERSLEKTLLGNKFDFSKSGESLNFKLSDLFRD
jgi:hypothetical protein